MKQQQQQEDQVTTFLDHSSRVEVQGVVLGWVAVAAVEAVVVKV
jgi:hypothetical protein